MSLVSGIDALQALGCLGHRSKVVFIMCECTCYRNQGAQSK